MRVFKNNHLVLTVLTLFCLVVLTACGEKAPPVPPVEKGQLIAPPHDLKLTSKDNTVFLSWAHKVDPESAAVIPDRFDVFVAKTQIGGCVGCPFKFKLAESVPVTQKQFSTQVEPGYKYYFRIQASGPDNLKSTYTKTVQFESK